MLKDPITATSLDLSFDFEILNFKSRIIDIKIKGLLRDLKYSDKYFDWFAEDIVEFLLKNGFQRRWDIGLIRLHNLEALKLDKKDLDAFRWQFKSVSSWDMEEVNENSNI